jgi:hypothetical protein
MRYTEEINGFSLEEDKKAEEIAKSFIESGRKEQIKSEIEQLVDDEFERLGDYAVNFITETAASRAEKFLSKVLGGDENAVRALLDSTDDSSRYRSSGSDAGEPWAKSYHGSIFETDAIRTRRKIVEAHKDLIESERIKDLESIVEGLRKQVTELQELERQWF